MRNVRLTNNLSAEPEGLLGEPPDSSSVKIKVCLKEKSEKLPRMNGHFFLCNLPGFYFRRANQGLGIYTQEASYFPSPIQSTTSLMHGHFFLCNFTVFYFTRLLQPLKKEILTRKMVTLSIMSY